MFGKKENAEEQKVKRDRSLRFFALIAIGGMVLIPIVVILMSRVPKTQTWLNPQCSIGDLITFLSTYILGMLALWQNLRLKEANEKAQDRLERINKTANELSIVNKMIEYEFIRFEGLTKALDEFSNACDPQMLAAKYARAGDDVKTILAEMANCEVRIDESFFALSRSLRTDPKVKRDDEFPIKKDSAAYYYAVKDFIKKIQKTPKCYPGTFAVMNKARKDYLRAREEYLGYREVNLNKLIYGKLSIEEITRIFSSRDV